MFPAPAALRVANLIGMVWLREQCKASATRASLLFGIDADDAQRYAQLAPGAIEGLCSELDLALLVPRYDQRSLPAVLAAAGRAAVVKSLPGDLELHNLSNLQALRDTCRRSPGEAVWAYGIGHEAAVAYAALDDAAVVALGRALGVSAFVPRYRPAQLAELAAKPAGMRALFAAAFEPEVIPTEDAARRGAFLTH